MNRLYSLFLLMLGCQLALGKPPAERPAKTVMSLEGYWQYRLDPENIGLKEGWFRQEFADSLLLPGTLDKAGAGPSLELDTNEMNREVMLRLARKHRYTGPAWYRKEIRVPAAWAGKDIRLFLERVLWHSTVWLNGEELGSQESLSTPHQYGLGKLKPGRNVLVLRIDNSRRYDISHRTMAHAYTDETQTIWNGVIGKMYLEALPQARILSLQVFPGAKARLLLENASTQPQKLRLLLEVRSGKDLLASTAREMILEPGRRQEELALEMSDSAGNWDEFNPRLYTLKASLHALGKKRPEAAIHERSERFGLRELRAEGSRLLLNGRRLFLRGTLECNIFPLDGHPPMDKAGWLKVFESARAYGLNHLRFHSWCPPEMAFEVADSLGFYLQAELPLWTLNFGEDSATVRFIREEAVRIMEAYGNHPSFCFWSLGNELQGDFGLLKSILEELKARDPRRLYTTTSFTFQKGHGDWPEEQDEFFVTQWTRQGWVRGQGIFNDRYPDFHTDYSAAIEGVPVPVITHEIGQYSVYPVMEEIGKYTGVLQPLNFMAVRNDLRRKGMLGRADEFTRASGKLAVLLYKEEIERALKTGELSGFQLLDLHDFPGQGTALVGILDAFWDSKGLVEPGDFRAFCGPVVPLLRFAKAVYTSGERFQGRAELSNYGPEDLENLQAEWTVSSWEDGPAGQTHGGKAGSVLASGSFPVSRAPTGGLSVLGEISISLAGVREASKLKVEIRVPGTEYRNSWPIWVYPESAQGAGKPVLFTRSAEEAFRLLEEGRKVLLNPDTAGLKGVDGRFTQVFWSPVHFPDQPGTMGLLCDPAHPAFAGFPTDFHSNWQWWDLVMRSKSLVIDSLPPVEPLVRVIDNFFKNRKMALILEARVGEGSLLLCAADIASELEKRPAARQLRYSLLNYMQGEDFKPEAELSVEQIMRLIKPY